MEQLLENVKVSQMTGNKNQPVKNQFIIHTPGATYFQSYRSIIVKTTWDNGKRVIILDENKWDYSRTTGKYRNLFLGETKAETEKKIKSGVYQLADLN